MEEFDLIEKYLRPLTDGHSEALNLTDDAAIINAGERDLIITKDALTENVHFLPDTPPKILAAKLAGVNLSDMSAMGAKPLYCLISSILPRDTDEKWIAAFARELGKIQDKYGFALIGGDTVSHDAPITLTMTMIGEVKTGKALLRSGAKTGDYIYVSGTIGDAALGLKSAKGEIPHNDYLIDRYNIPQPRVELGKKLIGIANAAIDISDGLIADLSHICKCSKVSSMVNSDDVPLSEEVRKLCHKGELTMLETILTGGDDYELLFTASPEKESEINEISEELSLPITKIGEITLQSKNKVSILDNTGLEIEIQSSGYRHYS